ncbi:MAG TPA: hypothetical protein VGG60_10760 [Candidatus Binataceae bacterium]
MEASRPAPVRLAQFDKGESRDAVIAKLGAPVTTTTDADAASCDLYSLPLSGYNNWAKAGIAFGELVADFGTLGIAEAVSTPTEAATRNRKTPVWFCYKNNALVRVTPKRLEGEDLASSERPAAAGGAQSQPSALPTTTQKPMAAPAATPAAAPSLSE